MHVSQLYCTCSDIEAVRCPTCSIWYLETLACFTSLPLTTSSPAPDPQAVQLFVLWCLLAPVQSTCPMTIAAAGKPSTSRTLAADAALPEGHPPVHFRSRKLQSQVRLRCSIHKTTSLMTAMGPAWLSR